MGEGAMEPTELSAEWVCRRIVEEAHDAVIFADREGKIRLWNTGAEETFGYTAEEALGQSLDLIIPEKHRPSHWAGYYWVMETGVTRYGRDLLKVPALRKDGRRISIEFTIVPVKDGTGRMLGIAAIIRDVTRRWEEEKALRTRLAELEARLTATD
jgi:PAS domain S-box-containing protein